MAKELKNKLSLHLILGTLQLLLSIFWIYHISRLYYLYEYTDILFAFRIPNWVLIIEIIMSSFNGYLGIKLVRGKISLRKSYGIFILFMITGYLFENLYYLIY